MTTITENDVEQAAMEWLSEARWEIAYGPDIAPDQPASERADYAEVILEGRLRNALASLNPDLPQDALDDALRKLTNPNGSSVELRNREFHRMLVDGITVDYRHVDGDIRGAPVTVADFDHPYENDWVAVNQFTVTENQHRRRPDIVLFLNGLPIGIIELKNLADENATIRDAFQQLQTYKSELQRLFSFNELMIVSDGTTARLGTLTAGWEWFKPWRTITGKAVEDTSSVELQVLLKGVCSPHYLAPLLRDFIVFEDDGASPLVKKQAGYHQFHAVRTAVEETFRATAQLPDFGEEPGTYESGQQPGGKFGDRRIGVVWHTQGSGKSLTMAFFAGALARHPEMENPTIVVLTDRNDLDDQLFSTFSRCQQLLRQPPTQAESRADLRRKLSVVSGGVVFTTIQKFFPEKSDDGFPTLSERSNIVVIADEAHRSQYDFIDGFARHMRDALPNASFVGFTGTPIELQDANTRAVFGDYISIYDMQRSVQDGATVPIYYESRLAQLSLDEAEKPTIDPDFEEATEGEEVERKERLKTRWAQLEALVGAENRVKQIAADLLEHFEERSETMDGKAMVVCMSRRICVDLYNELVRLRPEWHDEDDGRGAVKVVMTGSASDPLEWQQHIRNKPRREELARRFRDPADSFRIVLVRDMWLTGFDAPSLHTMYADKPMRGHGLMQAIARVNRVFSNKPGGLVVDYLGLADDLRKALATYTESGGRGKTTVDQEQAVAVMLEKYEICRGLFHGFDWSTFTTCEVTDRLDLIAGGQEHILAQKNGKDRCLKAVRELKQAFALSVPHAETKRIRDDVAFFDAVRVALAKGAELESRSDAELDFAIRQIVSRAMSAGGVQDIFAEAGLKKPDISVLSDEFLAEIRGMPRRNLAVELLQKLLRKEVADTRRENVVQARSFAEMLERTLRRYQNRAIEAAQVIEELIQLARELREARQRGEDLGLSNDELAFYDALYVNDSAVKVMGDEKLRDIARELATTVKNSTTIDWTVRENVRATLRANVSRLLRRHGYPPDKQKRATDTVLKQAEVLSESRLNER